MSTDVANISEYPDLVKTVETTLNGDGLNVLINNAGMYVATNLNDVTQDVIMEHFRINAVAPLLLVQVRVLHLDE